jgi:hypothetical protein
MKGYNKPLSPKLLWPFFLNHSNRNLTRRSGRVRCRTYGSRGMTGVSNASFTWEALNRDMSVLLTGHTWCHTFTSYIHLGVQQDHHIHIKFYLVNHKKKHKINHDCMETNMLADPASIVIGSGSYELGIIIHKIYMLVWGENFFLRFIYLLYVSTL